MEIKINDALEIVEIVMALEMRIERVLELYEHDSKTVIAIFNIYNQFKERCKNLDYKY